MIWAEGVYTDKFPIRMVLMMCSNKLNMERKSVVLPSLDLIVRAL